MEIIFERKFLKDIQKIKDKKLLKPIQTKVEEIEKIVNAHQDKGEIPVIPGMAKFQGYDDYFRI